MQVVLQKWETDIVRLFCKYIYIHIYIYIMDGFYLKRIWEKGDPILLSGVLLLIYIFECK